MRISAIKNANSHLLASSAVLLVAVLWLYYPVISGMVSDWDSNPNHSHGFIIPFLSAYFVWIRRDLLMEVKLKPTNWGALFLLGGIIMYVLGTLGAANTTNRVSMLFVLAGIILFVYGKELFKKLYFPFFLLIFMIPVPRYLYDAIAFPLKLFVTKYSVMLLNSIGILVFREGNVIMLENVTLQVVEACSGIRSLTSIIVVGVVLAYLSQRTTIKKIVLVLSTIPIAIGANISRIVITGMLAKSYGSSAAEGFFHEFAGIAVFIVEVVFLGLTAYLLSRIKRNEHETG